jgi:hypothetical protein
MLWKFGIFCGHLVYFPPFLVCCTYAEKSGNPDQNTEKLKTSDCPATNEMDSLHAKFLQGQKSISDNGSSFQDVCIPLHRMAP